MSDGSNRVAWSIDLNDMSCIVFAPTSAKARYIAVRGYWDAYGKRKGEWPRATAKREPRFDKSAVLFPQNIPYSRDYVEGTR